MNLNPITLIQSISSPSLPELLSKAADAGLSFSLKSSILDGIPIVGVINEAIRVGYEIRSTQYLRKIEIFLREVAESPTIDRENFATQFESESAKARFGESILLLLERAEDFRKPALLGRLVMALARRDINSDQAMRLAYIVDRCYTSDLKMLEIFRQGPMVANEPEVQSLFSAGLLSNAGIDGGDFEGNGGTIYQLNRYGEIMLKHVLTDTYQY
jgi:hypothetical protein